MKEYRRPVSMEGAVVCTGDDDSPVYLAEVTFIDNLKQRETYMMNIQRLIEVRDFMNKCINKLEEFNGGDVYVIQE